MSNETSINHKYVIKRMIFSHKKISYLSTLSSHLLDIIFAKQTRLLGKACILPRQVLLDKTRQGRQEI